jgi:hypothetical protein
MAEITLNYPVFDISSKANFAVSLVAAFWAGYSNLPENQCRNDWAKVFYGLGGIETVCPLFYCLFLYVLMIR